jgi:predicted transcriptional regulator YheO
MSHPAEAKNSSHIGRTTSKPAFLIESLKIVVDAIAKTFGPRCEVVLHDLKDLDRSIIKIENGHVTGRTIGGSITDKGLRHLRSGSEKSLLINYPSTTKEGRRLKSTTMIFRNEKKVPIAAICINFDVTDILSFNAIIEDMFSISEEPDQDLGVETFESDIVVTLSQIADEIIRKPGKAIPSMGKEDKIEIVRQLDEQGLFLIKGAIKLIAGKLNISKFTIYNYLDQIRSENKTSKPH